MKSGKGDGHNLVFLALLALALLIAGVLAVLYPLFLSGRWAYLYRRHSILPKPLSKSDFSFTRAEMRILVAINENLKCAEAELANVRKLGTHLAKRRDGYFNERSKLGTSLNSKLKENILTISQYRSEKRLIEIFLQSRSDHYSLLTASLRVYTFAVATYLIALTCVFFAAPSWLTYVNDQLYKLSFLDFLLLPDNLISGLLLAAFGSSVVLAFCNLNLSSIATKALPGSGGRTDAEAVLFSEAYAKASKIGLL